MVETDSGTKPVPPPPWSGESLVPKRFWHAKFPQLNATFYLGAPASSRLPVLASGLMVGTFCGVGGREWGGGLKPHRPFWPLREFFGNTESRQDAGSPNVPASGSRHGPNTIRPADSFALGQYPCCRQDAGAPRLALAGAFELMNRDLTSDGTCSGDNFPGSAGILAGTTLAPDSGWRSRGYLPHFDQPGLVQAITIRLVDSVPEEIVMKWVLELGLADGGGNAQTKKEGEAGGTPAVPGGTGFPKLKRQVELRKRLATYEDEGHGECCLGQARVAEMVQGALQHFDGARYRMLAWCVMPNHVHVLIESMPGWPLANVVHAWKSFSANRANELLGRTGAFWFRDYYDRYIRDARHFAKAMDYIEQNPVKAGLVAMPKLWPFSSAGKRVVGAKGVAN